MLNQNKINIISSILLIGSQNSLRVTVQYLQVYFQIWYIYETAYYIRD